MGADDNVGLMLKCFERKFELCLLSMLPINHLALNILLYRIHAANSDRVGVQNIRVTRGHVLLLVPVYIIFMGMLYGKLCTVFLACTCMCIFILQGPPSRF